MVIKISSAVLLDCLWSTVCETFAWRKTKYVFKIIRIILKVERVDMFKRVNECE